MTIRVITETVDGVANDIVLYERCNDCHLFIDVNYAYDDAPGLAPFVHLCGDSPADEELDGSHEPMPSGEVATLSVWRAYGPAAMRARFTS